LKAEAVYLYQLLEGEKQYVVPLFQRYYVWDKEQWKQLWNDIFSLLEKSRIEEHELVDEHFLGAIVCMPGGHVPYTVPQYILIDGHQRLATLTILFCALRDLAREKGLGELGDEIQEKYLIDKYKRGLERYKMISRLKDRDLLFALIDSNLPSDLGLRFEKILRAYKYFKEKITEECQNEEELRRLFQIITKRLAVVMITLDPKDNPFIIFETLNWRGQPLEEADLIRNYIFMHVPIDKQDEFDEKVWTPFEKIFKGKDGSVTINITDFYRDYLMSRGQYVKKREVYLQFRRQLDLTTDLDPWRTVDDLRRYGKFYILIHRPSEADNPDLREELKCLESLDVSTSYPLLLYLLDKYYRGELSIEDLLESLRCIESFVIRRLVCGETTRPYNYWFPQAIKKIKEKLKDGGEILDALLEFLNEKGWPDNERFKESLLTFPIYSSAPKMCRTILEELEKSYEHKEPVDLSVPNIQIEHIMPRVLSEEWREMLGSDCERIHETYLHTIGNLTLSGYNQELYNKPYPQKRKRLRESNITLNRYFDEVEFWNEEEIVKRGRKLAEEIAKLWPRFSIL